MPTKAAFVFLLVLTIIMVTIGYAAPSAMPLLTKNQVLTEDDLYAKGLTAPSMTEQQWKQLWRSAPKVYLPLPGEESSFIVLSDPEGQPEVGTTDIRYYKAALGGIIWDDSEYGLFDVIKNILLWALGCVSDPAGDIVLFAVNASVAEWNEYEPVKAFVGHSYVEEGKEGLVYTESSLWKVYYTCHSRLAYKHWRGEFTDTQGYMRQECKDFTPTNGYGPIKEEWSAHWNDHVWIMDEARYRWEHGLPPGEEYGWTY